MSHDPEVLTLLLKRYKFDHSCRRYVKINCKVRIPDILQIKVCHKTEYSIDVIFIFLISHCILNVFV